MDSFWKELTDIRLLPLTTEYYPGHRSQKFNEEPGYVETRGLNYEHTFQENLCLRLTQNFQFVSPNGTCNFRVNNSNEDEYKMAFRDRYARCRPSKRDQQLESTTWLKYKTLLNDKVYAQFRYLLFNYQTNDF